MRTVQHTRGGWTIAERWLWCLVGICCFFSAETWQSYTVGSNPIPTKLSEHVTRSMHLAPDAESLNRQVDTMGDPIIWMGSWSLAPSRECWWLSLVGYPQTWTEQSPHILVGCWEFAATLCLWQHDLLGQSGLCSHLGGGSGIWTWPSPSTSHWECPLEWAWWVLLCYVLVEWVLLICMAWFYPIRGWDIFLICEAS